MTKNIIETFNLTKIYKLKNKKKIIALHNINLNVQENEIFGLLGPNGAGKTTLVQLLTTLKSPTSGNARINGYNVNKSPKKAKENIALMLDRHMLYLRITGYANLKFFCKIYKVPVSKEKIMSLAKEFKLDRWINQLVETYSNGMQMKLAMIRTLLLDRNILFLDEPTLGLDIESKNLIIKKLKNIGKTIFLTSHDMGVVEQLCDRIAFINRGNIIKIVNKGDIKNLMLKDINIEIQVKNNHDQLRNELKQQDWISEIDKKDNILSIYIRHRDYYNDLLTILNKYNVMKLTEKESSLEDFFLHINKELENA